MEEIAHSFHFLYGNSTEQNEKNKMQKKECSTISKINKIWNENNNEDEWIMCACDVQRNFFFVFIFGASVLYFIAFHFIWRVKHKTSPGYSLFNCW